MIAASGLFPGSDTACALVPGFYPMWSSTLPPNDLSSSLFVHFLSALRKASCSEMLPIPERLSLPPAQQPISYRTLLQLQRIAKEERARGHWGNGGEDVCLS